MKVVRALPLFLVSVAAATTVAATEPSKDFTSLLQLSPRPKNKAEADRFVQEKVKELQQHKHNERQLTSFVRSANYKIILNNFYCVSENDSGSHAEFYGTMYVYVNGVAHTIWSEPEGRTMDMRRGDLRNVHAEINVPSFAYDHGSIIIGGHLWEDDWTSGDDYLGYNVVEVPKNIPDSQGSDAWCGGHAAPHCTQCPDDKGIFRGSVWCNGECSWSSHSNSCTGPKQRTMSIDFNRGGDHVRTTWTIIKTEITARPTSRPTNRPTRAPTQPPTKSPTKSPTNPPTRSPTKNPTRSPTDVPTGRPTDSPTVASDHPSASPTTGSPTTSPTSPPTQPPTRLPTTPPTQSPTANPTESPSGIPTAAPTTEAPTSSPTAAVLTCPSKLPRGNSTCTGVPGTCFYDKTKCDGEEQFRSMATCDGRQWNVIAGMTCHNDRQPEKNTTKPSKGSSSGDPHFMTWSGEKYDYHGECDLVLADSPTFHNGLGLRVHIRTTRIKYFSYIEQVAVQIGRDVLEFSNDVENFLINGEKVEAQKKHHKTMLAGFAVRRDPKAISIRLQDGTGLHQKTGAAKIDLIQRRNGFPAVVVDGGSTDVFKGSLGLLGEWGTGKKMARDGTTEMKDDDATAFALEWQVRDTEPMLFKEARFPQHPTECTPPAKIPGNRLGSKRTQLRNAAEEACGHWNEEDKEDCVFDVMATGDVSVAEEGSHMSAASA